MAILEYQKAADERLALRRKLKRQLQQVSEAHSVLSAAAGKVRMAESTLGSSSNPLSEILPLVAEASTLARKISEHDAQMLFIEKALGEAKARARSVRRLLVIVAVCVIVIIAVFVVAR